MNHLNLNVNQGVITAKSLQNTINNCSGMVNLHVPNFFLRKTCMSEYKTTLQATFVDHERILTGKYGVVYSTVQYLKMYYFGLKHFTEV